MTDLRNSIHSGSNLLVSLLYPINTETIKRPEEMSLLVRMGHWDRHWERLREAGPTTACLREGRGGGVCMCGNVRACMCGELVEGREGGRRV